jgi:hypothetical protein
MAPKHGRQVVMIGILPEGWKPQRPWDIPPRLDSVEVYVRNVSSGHAAGFVRAFNKRQLGLGLPDRKWALYVRHTKYRQNGEHPDAIRKRREAKGGAA